MNRKSVFGFLFVGFVAGVIWVAACGGSSGTGVPQANAADDAADITYSGNVNADNVKDAIDAVAASVPDEFTAADARTAVAAEDITGTITADGFSLAAAKTAYLSIAGAAFNPATAGNFAVRSTANHADRANSQAGDYFAAVHLPHGATVTSVTSYVLNNAGGETITVTFESYPLDTDSAVTEVTTSTFDADSADIQSDEQEPAANDAEIDNLATAYVVRANFSGAAADSRLKGVVIEYTYQDL